MCFSLSSFFLQAQDLGRDVIKYMDDELLNLDDERQSHSGSLLKSIKDHFHGKKGVLGHTEPNRDLAGFITSSGRDHVRFFYKFSRMLMDVYGSH